MQIALTSYSSLLKFCSGAEKLMAAHTTAAAFLGSALEERQREMKLGSGGLGG